MKETYKRDTFEKKCSSLLEIYTKNPCIPIKKRPAKETYKKDGTKPTNKRDAF